jgi:hypothetical protein
MMPEKSLLKAMRKVVPKARMLPRDNPEFVEMVVTVESLLKCVLLLRSPRRLVLGVREVLTTIAAAAVMNHVFRV